MLRSFDGEAKNKAAGAQSRVAISAEIDRANLTLHCVSDRPHLTLSISSALTVMSSSLPSSHGTLAHLLPPSWKSIITSWLAEDTPSFDYGGFVVGEAQEQAFLWGKAQVRGTEKTCFGPAPTDRPGHVRPWRDKKLMLALVVVHAGHSGWCTIRERNLCSTWVHVSHQRSARIP